MTTTPLPTIEQVKTMNETELLDLAHKLHEQGAKRKNKDPRDIDKLYCKAYERLYNKGYRADNIIHKTQPTNKPNKKPKKQKSESE